MKLSYLLSQVNSKYEIILGDCNLDLDFSDISQDSRAVTPASIYFALRGTSFDAVNFIPSVIKSGVKIVFVHGQFKQDLSQNNQLVIIKSDSISTLLAECLNIFYSNLPKNIFAVTGTNGKTSVADFTRQGFNLLGVKASSIGTLGVVCDSINDKEIAQSILTTPDIVTLYKNLALLKSYEVDNVIIEASSIALDQKRVAGIRFAAAIFTNLSQDHLDYHESMENYFNSKMLLFKDYLAKGSPAIINSDIKEYSKIKQICIESDLKIIDFGFNAKSLKIVNIAQIDHGQEVTLSFGGEEYKFQISLYGEFNVYNILSALALIISQNNFNKAQLGDFLSKLSKVKSALGRVDKIATLKNSAQIFIDFAHTPDALEKILKLSRHFTKNRLIVLFGCGGNRDIGKRSQMGKIANDLADLAIITDDNPRDEDPAQIRSEIISLCNSNKAIEKSGRRNAIKYAVSILQTGDVLILAGKGHEKYQIIKDQSIDFDERLIIQEIIKELNA